MATVILVSIFAPIAAGVLFLAGRNRLPRHAADTRGIALQTIIIIVVLIAIAGTVAAVLLSRAGQETGRLEEVGDSADQCRALGGTVLTAVRANPAGAVGDCEIEDTPQASGCGLYANSMGVDVSRHETTVCVVDLTP